MSETLFDKATGLLTWNCIKKSLQYRCFALNSAKCLWTPFLQNTSDRLFLLYIRFSYVFSWYYSFSFLVIFIFSMSIFTRTFSLFASLILCSSIFSVKINVKYFVVNLISLLGKFLYHKPSSFPQTFRKLWKKTLVSGDRKRN